MMEHAQLAKFEEMISAVTLLEIQGCTAAAQDAKERVIEAYRVYVEACNDPM